MANRSLLICMTDLPFPARKNGISIRYQPIISHLSKSFDIDLVVVADHPEKEQSISEAEKYCSSVHVHVRKRIEVPFHRKVLARVVSLLPRTKPFVYHRYDESQIREFFRTAVEGKQYDFGLCVCLTYFDLMTKYASYKKLFLDFIDSPYSAQSRVPKNSIFDNFDLAKLQRYERSVLRAVDHAIYISPLDLQIGSGKNGPEKGLSIVPNGLNLEGKSDEKIDFGKPTIGYLGHMSYPPNIKAAIRLLKIHRSLREEYSDLELVIIGRSPSKNILAHQHDPGVTVTGTVDNIWPYINGVDIFVFPMEIGSGQQNKILEAMGAGKPVITTPLGNSGIGATNGYQIIEASSDTDIAKKVGGLLSNKKAADDLGEAGLAYIVQKYCWLRILENIDKIFH